MKLLSVSLAIALSLTPLPEVAEAGCVRGHFRSGKYVRPYCRRSPTNYKYIPQASTTTPALRFITPNCVKEPREAFSTVLPGFKPASMCPPTEEPKSASVDEEVSKELLCMAQGLGYPCNND